MLTSMSLTCHELSDVSGRHFWSQAERGTDRPHMAGGREQVVEVGEGWEDDSSSRSFSCT